MVGYSRTKSVKLLISHECIIDPLVKFHPSIPDLCWPSVSCRALASQTCQISLVRTSTVPAGWLSGSGSFQSARSFTCPTRLGAAHTESISDAWPWAINVRAMPELTRFSSAGQHTDDLLEARHVVSLRRGWEGTGPASVLLYQTRDRERDSREC